MPEPLYPEAYDDREPLDWPPLADDGDYYAESMPADDPEERTCD